MSDPARNSEPGTLEEDYLRRIARLHVLWQNTGNPVYVWGAIGLCYRIPIARHRDLTGEWMMRPPEAPHPFPTWCLEYLHIVAVRIGALADGVDFRNAVQPWGSALSPPSPEKLDASLESGEAANLLASALGIRRNGGNAFADYQSLEKKGLDLLSLLHFTEVDGQTRSAALSRIADENEDRDARNVERRIADYKRAHGVTKRRP